MLGKDLVARFIFMYVEISNIFWVSVAEIHLFEWGGRDINFLSFEFSEEKCFCLAYFAGIHDVNRVLKDLKCAKRKISQLSVFSKS